MTSTSDAPVVDRIEQYSADFAEVVRFLSYMPAGRSIPSLYSARYFEWKIAHNPFGHSAAFLRTRNGQPAAHLCVTAKPANPGLLGDARIGELCDAHTHPKFQRQGHFGAIGPHVIRHFAEADTRDSLVFAGGPNANSLPGFLRQCGCLQIEAMALRHVRLLPWKRARRWPADWLSRFRSRTTLERAGDVESTMRVIDAIWEEARSTDWLVWKSGAWWRYRYAEATEPYVTYLIRVGANIQGWAVVKRLASRWPMVYRTAVCDIVGVSPEVEVAGLRAILRSIAGPIDVVEAWTQRGTPVGDASDHLGFSLMRDVPIVYANNNAFRQLMATGRVPRLSMGDTDQV